MKATTTTKRVTKMRPRSPQPVTTRRDPVETRERRKNRRKLGSKLKDEFSIISTETEIQGQEVILIMKHVKLTVQGEKYQDKDEVNKAKIEGAPQQYIAKHFIEESCSQSRSIHEPMELSSRCTQVVWPSGGNYYRQHRFNKSCYLEQGSQGREQVESRISGSPRLNCRTSSKRSRLRSQFLKKEIDTRNMNNVVTALFTGIDAAVCQVQQTELQFQATFNVEQSLESEKDLHRDEQDGQRHCRQQAGKLR